MRPLPALLLLAASTPLLAQTDRHLACSDPANPFRRYSECKHSDFDYFEETLLRHWAAGREALRAWGLTTTLGYTSSLLGNLSGGSNRALDYTGQLSAALDFNLEQLWRARGFFFHVDGSWGTGGNLSATIGNLMTVSELYAPSYYLGEMYFEQRLLNGRLILDAGRLAPGITFAFLPVYGRYLNSAFNPNPIALSLNDVAYSPLPPGTQWGAQVIYHPAENIDVLGGVFNNNPNSAAGNRHGVDFNISEGNKGALWTAQVNFLRNPRGKDRRKPGQYTLGGFYDTNYFNAASNSSTGSNHNYGMYALAQQMVYAEEGTAGRQGTTVWGSVTYSPKQTVSLMPVMIGAGLKQTGLFPKRDRDVMAIGWFAGKVSGYLPGTAAEQVAVANYTFQVNRAVTLAGNFQYILKPGGYPVPGAAVLGTVLGVTF
jgi:porin